MMAHAIIIHSYVCITRIGRTCSVKGAPTCLFLRRMTYLLRLPTYLPRLPHAMGYLYRLHVPISPRGSLP